MLVWIVKWTYMLPAILVDLPPSQKRQKKSVWIGVDPRGPDSKILMVVVGGPTEVGILYSKKSQLQNLSTQKNHYFFSIPKKIP